MTRQEYNHIILDQIKNSDFSIISDHLEYFIDKFPDQRFGQILCNYICNDYKTDMSVFTEMLFGWLFPNIDDPFFEESKETYNRLINND